MIKHGIFHFLNSVVIIIIEKNYFICKEKFRSLVSQGQTSLDGKMYDLSSVNAIENLIYQFMFWVTVPTLCFLLFASTIMLNISY